MKPFEFRELLRENLHGTVHEALKEVTTDMSEFFSQVHCGYINLQNSSFVLINNILTNDRVSHVAQKDLINVSVVLSVNLQHLILPILCQECFSNNS